MERGRLYWAGHHSPASVQLLHCITENTVVGGGGGSVASQALPEAGQHHKNAIRHNSGGTQLLCEAVRLETQANVGALTNVWSVNIETRCKHMARHDFIIIAC